MTLGATYHLREGLWRRRGRPPIVPSGYDDGFVVGLTKPTTSNTGCLAGVTRLPYDGPQIIDAAVLPGTLDPSQPNSQTNPYVVSSRNVDKLITVKSGWVVWFNCAFSGGPGTFNTGLVDTRPSGVLGVTFERCDFDPGAAKASFWLDAVIGHHITMRRCRARRVVDLVGSYNTYATRTDNVIEANLLEWLVRYDDDSPNHTDGTHNDGIQHQGGIGLRVVGNVLNGYSFYADGTTVPPGNYRLGAQGVLVQQNVAIGGLYYADEIEISDNWFAGWQHPISLKTRNPDPVDAPKGAANNPRRFGTPFDSTVVDNVWENDDQRYYGTTAWEGGVGRPYIIRTGTETVINGDTSIPTDGQPYPAGGNNRYSPTAVLTRESLRGDLVTIRRDPFAGG